MSGENNVEIFKREEPVASLGFDGKTEMEKRISISKERFDSNTQVFISKEFKDINNSLSNTLLELIKNYNSYEEKNDEQKRKREEIDKVIINFFENNKDEKEMYIIAPSSALVITSIAKYFSENYLKLFESNEEKRADIRLILGELLNNIERYHNKNHLNNFFYFHSSINKENNLISFEFRDFNPPISEEVKKNTFIEETSEELEKSICETPIEEFEGNGLQNGHAGKGLKIVNQLTKVNNQSTLIFDNWYDEQGNILGNKITCSVEL